MYKRYNSNTIIYEYVKIIILINHCLSLAI